MDYDSLRVFADTWGLVFLVVLFLVVVGFALWPDNRRRFERASRIPFEED